MTELDVVNDALFMIKESPLTDISESGKVGDAVRFQLPQVRQTVLQAYDWACARKREKLVRIEEESPGIPVINESGRRYVYAMPTDCIAIRDVIDTYTNTMMYGSTQVHATYLIEQERIYTDLAEPLAIYTYDLTDATKWDPLLAGAIAAYLAYKIAFYITGDRNDEQAALQAYSGYITLAKTQSALEMANKPRTHLYIYPGLFDEDQRI